MLCFYRISVRFTSVFHRFLLDSNFFLSHSSAFFLFWSLFVLLAVVVACFFRFRLISDSLFSLTQNIFEKHQKLHDVGTFIFAINNKIEAKTENGKKKNSMESSKNAVFWIGCICKKCSSTNHKYTMNQLNSKSWPIEQFLCGFV